MIKGYAAHLNAEYINGDFSKIEEMLAAIQEAGYDAAELHPSAYYCIRNGEYDEKRAEKVAEITNRFSLQYTVHAPFTTPHTKDPEKAKRLGLSLIRFCKLVGSQDLVLHPSQDKPQERFHNGEVDTLRFIALNAHQKGVSVHLENLPPFSDDPDYSYGERLDRVACIVDEIGLGVLGVCLDTGHAGIASTVYNTDLVKDVRAVADRITHIHFHDNYGQPTLRNDKRWWEATAQGIGDLHLPAGWGALPLRDVVSVLKAADYSGWVVVEIRNHFRDDWKKALEVTKTMWID